MKKSLLAFLIAVILMLGSVPAVTASPPLVEWSYDNSLAVTVSVPESRSFSPADFPGVNCHKVVVLEKAVIEDDVQYTLVLKLNVADEAGLLSAMNTIDQLPIVQNVRRTSAEEYVTRDVSLKIDRKQVTVSVGETVDVQIEQIEYFPPSYLVNLGVEFDVSSKFFDFDDPRWDWIPQEDIRTFVVEDERTSYYFLSRSIKDGFVGDEFDMVAYLSQYPEFLKVRIYTDAIIGGRQAYEKWSVAESDIARVTVSGGEKVAWSSTELGQVAHVRGLKAGTTTLLLERAEFGGLPMYALCTVEVTGDGEIGDVDANGTISADDALLTLQQAASKITLDDGSQMFADYDGDSQITAADALLILQKATGKFDG